MELRQYWNIIWARWPLIVALTVIAVLLSVVASPRSMTSYRAAVRLSILPEQEIRTGTFYGYDGYYAYVATELLIDDLGKVVEGGAFLQDARAHAARRYGRVASGTLEMKKAHRVATIDATANNAEDALALVTAAADLLLDPESRYFKVISGAVPEVTVVDMPAIVSTTPASRIGLDIAVRALLGFAVGIALAFLLDYLDDSVRGRVELEERFGLSVLGEIPAVRRRRPVRE